MGASNQNGTQVVDAARRYYVAWVSVDGAGQVNAADEAYLSLAEASAECERLQRACEVPREVSGPGGSSAWYVNPWDYAYRVVDGRYDTVYRAFTTRAKQVQP